MSQLATEKTAKAVDKRQSIIDAAIHAFADKGYHMSRISDIAQQAGIVYGLAYHYFKNKEEILDTIFLDGGGGGSSMPLRRSPTMTETQKRNCSRSPP